jgi:hypothetical protein
MRARRLRRLLTGGAAGAWRCRSSGTRGRGVRRGCRRRHHDTPFSPQRRALGVRTPKRGGNGTWRTGGRRTRGHDARAAGRRRPTSISFDLNVFHQAKLQNLSTKLYPKIKVAEEL